MRGIYLNATTPMHTVSLLLRTETLTRLRAAGLTPAEQARVDVMQPRRPRVLNSWYAHVLVDGHTIGILRIDDGSDVVHFTRTR